MQDNKKKAIKCPGNISPILNTECLPFEAQVDILINTLTLDENGNIYDFFGKNIIGWAMNGTNNRVRCKLYNSEIRFNCNIQRKPTSQGTKTLKYSVIDANYE